VEANDADEARTEEPDRQEDEAARDRILGVAAVPDEGEDQA
jgi:hypothetical protein